MHTYATIGAEAKKKVVITHWVHAEVWDYLSRFAVVSGPVEPGAVWSRERLIEEATDADALIMSMADSIDEDILAKFSNLQIVAATLKGYDNYDANACTRRNVWLSIVPDTIIPPTAELALALTLAVMRNIQQGDKCVRNGMFEGWRPQLYGKSLSGAKVGILGMGDLGTAITHLLKPFGIAKLFYVDREEKVSTDLDQLHTQRADLISLLAACDVIIVTLPLSESTYHLINATTLAHLKTGAYIINIGRGSVVDEQAILEILNTGQLAGYGADVFGLEDWLLPTRIQSIPSQLLQHPNTIFTPHLGSAVDDVRKKMSLSAARQVQQALSGQKPEHAVNSLDRVTGSIHGSQ